MRYRPKHGKTDPGDAPEDGSAMMETGLSTKHPALSVYLARAAFWFDDAVQQRLKRQGLITTSRTQALVIANLTLGETRPSRLAKAVGITAQAMSHVLSELVDIGMAELVVDENDARARVVKLTPMGLEHREQVRVILSDLETLLEARFGRPVIDVVRMVVAADWGPPPEPPLDPTTAEPTA